jgi:hypothetical protein
MRLNDDSFSLIFDSWRVNHDSFCLIVDSPGLNDN